MIIDFHTHIFPPWIKQARAKYAELDPGFALFYANPKAKIITADELITSMDEQGIEVSVALNIYWSTGALCTETNDYILESAARYPGRLIGFCAIPTGSTTAAVSEIERCAKAGAQGIGELRFTANDISGDSFVPIADTISNNRLILLTHASEPVGHQYPGKGNMTPDLLYRFITQFPGLTIVLAHWGGGLPFYTLMPEVKQALNNVYFDSAASPFLYSPEVYKHVVGLVGADRALFGSDYPLLSQDRLLKQIKGVLSGDALDLFLSGNACRLLGIDKR